MDSVRRICIDARFYHTGTGIARYLKNFLQELPKADPNTVYTIIVRPESAMELKKTSPKHWDIVGLDIPHYSLAEQTVFLSYLNRKKFDLVYFTMFNHPLLYRGKCIVMIHDLIMHMYPPRPLWHPRTWVYRLVMSHAARASDAIITNSQTTTRDVVKWLNVPVSKCHTIYLAVEDSFKPAVAEAVVAAKTKFGITKPYLFFLNAWRPHKGLTELVAAFSKINQARDIQLVIGGKSDPRFPEIIEAVHQRKSADTIVLGFITDEELVALLTGSLLYVNPSHYEGFGFGLLEAMACGAPVLAADNACFKEIGGDAVAYFATKSADDLASKLTNIIDDNNRRKELKTRGFKHVKNFSFSNMAQQTLALFNKILST